MKFAALLMSISLIILGYSATLEPFERSPDGTSWESGIRHRDSKAYFEARSQALTYKYKLQDYGGTVMMFGLVVALLYTWRPKAPASRKGFVLIAVMAPFLTVGSFVFDLSQGMDRREFPPWADSIGIPLMGVPVMLFMGLAWSFAHFTLLAGVLIREKVPITFAMVRKGNKWLLVAFGLTILLILLMSIDGTYWYAAPGFLWLYYYASISAVRHSS